MASKVYTNALLATYVSHTLPLHLIINIHCCRLNSRFYIATPLTEDTTADGRGTETGTSFVLSSIILTHSRGNGDTLHRLSRHGERDLELESNGMELVEKVNHSSGVFGNPMMIDVHSSLHQIPTSPPPHKGTTPLVLSNPTAKSSVTTSQIGDLEPINSTRPTAHFNDSRTHSHRYSHSVDGTKSAGSYHTMLRDISWHSVFLFPELMQHIPCLFFLQWSSFIAPSTYPTSHSSVSWGFLVAVWALYSSSGLSTRRLYVWHVDATSFPRYDTETYPLFNLWFMYPYCVL